MRWFGWFRRTKTPRRTRQQRIDAFVAAEKQRLERSLMRFREEDKRIEERERRRETEELAQAIRATCIRRGAWLPGDDVDW